MAAPNLNVPWTSSPLFESLLDQSGLAESDREMVERFARDGYLEFDPEIPAFDELAARIIGECSTRSEYPQRLADAWPQIEGIRRIATWPRVLSVLRTLYRREPIPMQTLNFGRGTEQRAHSDAMHFDSVPHGFMCGVWVALEDVDEDNGPLEYYPGSQRLPLLDHLALGLTGSEQRGYEHYGAYEELVQSLIRGLKLERRVLRVPRGRAIVWAANLLHGGSPIKDPARSRHSQVTHYYFEGCLYYQPQRSDPFLGQIQWLDKRDVRTGLLIPQVYNGRPARVRRGFRQGLEWWARRAGLDRMLKGSPLLAALRRALR
jgi:Phytanoyl-CoA dioxygenase (PhyH)